MRIRTATWMLFLAAASGVLNRAAAERFPRLLALPAQTAAARISDPAERHRRLHRHCRELACRPRRRPGPGGDQRRRINHRHARRSR